MSHLSLLFASPLVEVQDSICHSPRSGRGAVVAEGTTHIALIRRGCFDYHLGSRTCFADSCTALVYDEGAEFCTSHPTDGGDDCTIFTLDAGLMAELFGARRKNEQVEYRMSPAFQAGHLATHAALKRHRGDRLAAEEVALGLLHTVANQSVAVERLDAAGARQRRIVDATKRALNVRLDSNLGLAEVSREVGCSPYHLMRLFRARTGQSLRSYRSRLRIATAMDRLAHGEDNIAGLAVDLGFSSHSHLTNTFRSLLGVTPVQMRHAFGREDVAARRVLLDASLRAAA